MHESISRNQTYVARRVEYIEWREGLRGGAAKRPEWDGVTNKEMRERGERRKERDREMGPERRQILPNTWEILELAACQSTQSYSFVHVRANSWRRKLPFLCSNANDPRPVIFCFARILHLLLKIQTGPSQNHFRPLCTLCSFRCLSLSRDFLRLSINDLN